MEYNFLNHEPGKAILAIKGRIDAVSYLVFEEAVLTYFDDTNKKLLIDFSQIEYISSAGLRTLLRTVKKIKLNNGYFALFGVNDLNFEVLRVSGFLSMFEIFKTKDEALKNF